jgi:hypothetical protein
MGVVVSGTLTQLLLKRTLLPSLWPKERCDGDTSSLFDLYAYRSRHVL